jgi:hypothetical protein
MVYMESLNNGKFQQLKKELRLEVTIAREVLPFESPGE